MKEKKVLEGMEVFKKVVLEAINRGLTPYEIAKYLSLFTNRIYNIVKGKNDPSVGDILTTKNIGFKPVVVFIPADNEELYRKIQSINQKAFEDMINNIMKKHEETVKEKERKKAQKKKKQQQEEQPQEIDLFEENKEDENVKTIEVKDSVKLEDKHIVEKVANSDNDDEIFEML